MKEKIILFGGSFDPIHNGHIAIAKEVMETISADRVIFIVAKSPRWKKTSESSFHRLEMLKIALKNYPKFEISEFELNKDDEIDYSIDTVRHFANLYKEAELYFLLGYDQLDRLDEWKDIDELTELAQIVAYRRPNVEFDEKNATKYDVMVIKSENYDVSSTLIRQMKSLDLPLDVLEYIHNNNLYFLKKVQEHLLKERFEHSKSVAHLALEIALNNDLNAKDAYFAGLLHDIGKNVSKEEESSIMEEQYKKHLNLPRFAYHQFVGAYLAKKDFDIDDQDIINAIMFHATGNKKMTPIGMVIYSSDKIEPLRGFDSSELIEACMKDYKEGFVKVLVANIEYLLQHNKDIDNVLTRACIDYYIK